MVHLAKSYPPEMVQSKLADVTYNRVSFSKKLRASFSPLTEGHRHTLRKGSCVRKFIYRDRYIQLTPVDTLYLWLVKVSNYLLARLRELISSRYQGSFICMYAELYGYENTKPRNFAENKSSNAAAT